MQEKESIMVVQYELKIPSPGMTVRHHSTNLVMPNSYPRTLNPHLTIIDSYNHYLEHCLVALPWLNMAERLIKTCHHYL